jgi:hypothetical protein
MLYAKAFAAGVVTGVLAPVVVGVASLVWFMGTLYLGGFAVRAGGPSWVVVSSVNLQSFYSTTTPERLVMQMAVGFAVGLLFTLWRALVKDETTR